MGSHVKEPPKIDMKNKSNYSWLNDNVGSPGIFSFNTLRAVIVGFRTVLHYILVAHTSTHIICYH